MKVLLSREALGCLAHKAGHPTFFQHALDLWFVNMCVAPSLSIDILRTLPRTLYAWQGLRNIFIASVSRCLDRGIVLDRTIGDTHGKGHGIRK